MIIIITKAKGVWTKIGVVAESELQTITVANNSNGVNNIPIKGRVGVSRKYLSKLLLKPVSLH